MRSLVHRHYTINLCLGTFITIYADILIDRIAGYVTKDTTTKKKSNWIPSLFTKWKKRYQIRITINVFQNVKGNKSSTSWWFSVGWKDNTLGMYKHYSKHFLESVEGIRWTCVRETWPIHYILLRKNRVGGNIICVMFTFYSKVEWSIYCV